MEEKIREETTQEVTETEEVTPEEPKSVFETLNAINVNEHTEQKNKLTYLSWAWAWAEVKKAYPDSFYTIYENADGWNYHTDGRTAWVKTGVTIEGLEHIEYLPVMDFKNNSIPLDKVTSFDVNKAIQRSLTKACARHGLGLYVYAGEDLPEAEKAEEKAAEEKKMEENIDDKERLTIEGICKKRGWDPAKKFKTWPNLSKKGYADFMNYVRSLDANNGEGK